MHPERADIAVPVLPGRIDWLHAAEPPDTAALTATGPLLVHFLDVAQLNSVRALPYLLEWRRRYEPFGLTVLGVHSPRFPFTGERSVLEPAIERLRITHPVANDSEYAIWHDYGCKGWPSIFLWGRGGALRWFHFGEGEYRATEEAITEELRSDDVTLELPEPMAPLRPSDAPGALVAPPSAEIFPGGSPAEPWAPQRDDSIELDYEAGECALVADGEGRLAFAIDGEPARELSPLEPGLQRLAEHSRHERHRLRLQASAGVRVWALSFAAGLP